MPMIECTPGTSRRQSWQPRLFLLGLCVMLFGCVRQPAVADVTPVPSAAFPPIPTATPVPVPSDTPTPAPTPPLSASLISDDFLFEPSSVPGCELPCWQGLEVGKSGREEIQGMFDTVFAFNGTRQFVPDNPPEPTLLPDNYYAAGHSWLQSLGGDYPQSFTVNVFFERDTKTLRALEFTSSYAPFNVHLSPYRIIRELGPPSHIRMSLSPTERGDVLRFQMRMVYDAMGMVFDFGEQFLPGSVAYFSDHTEGSVNLCLDDKTWNEEFVRYRKVQILGSLDADPESLNPLQEALLQFLSQGEPTLLTDFFGVSLEDITQMALQDSQECLFTEFSD